jgi:hypothetical protein
MMVLRAALNRRPVAGGGAVGSESIVTAIEPLRLCAEKAVFVDQFLV